MSDRRRPARLARIVFLTLLALAAQLALPSLHPATRALRGGPASLIADEDARSHGAIHDPVHCALCRELARSRAADIPFVPRATPFVALALAPGLAACDPLRARARGPTGDPRAPPISRHV